MLRMVLLAGGVALAMSWSTDRAAPLKEGAGEAVGAAASRSEAALQTVGARSTRVRALLGEPATDLAALRRATEALGVAMRDPGLDPHARTGANLLWLDAHRRLDAGQLREVARPRFVVAATAVEGAQ